jgi:hypothetical protein
MRSFRSCQNADSRLVFDELVGVGVSRLKASGAIRFEDRQAVILFGEQSKLIGAAQTKFPNSGSWAFLLCLQCGRMAKRLWLADDAPRCRTLPRKARRCHRAVYGFGRNAHLSESAIDPKLTRLPLSQVEVSTPIVKQTLRLTPHYSVPASSQPTRLALSLA